MGQVSIKQIERDIKDRTIDLTSSQYAEFMRELANWAENEAELAEYSIDCDNYDE